MARAPRLLRLLELLRTHRAPVKGDALARELGISLRSLYRDVATLKEQGALIEGAPGLGFVLRPGFTLPPLHFTVEELEALALGTQWVARHTDARLAEAAHQAMAKIRHVLPPERRGEADDGGLRVGPRQPAGDASVDVASLRQAIRERRKVALRYTDQRGKRSERVVWPFALGYFDRVRVVAAWCERQADFRHFRTDRIAGLRLLETRYPRSRESLQQAWEARGLKRLERS